MKKAPVGRAAAIAQQNGGAFSVHGGLCMDCIECVYPRCPFGKCM
ncbi:MAG: hypothetical protein PF503_03735 [Desulfobacula sp.]|jgi:hypothetical protein|nr:hypothetical protein [Desulfobacula sp.]